MVILYYNPDFKYTNRKIITITQKDNEMRTEINVAHLDTPDTINGHIIYNLGAISTLPTYLLDTDTDRRYFITGYTQLSGVKYQLSLLRDIISENPTLWAQETAYISSGMATDYNKYKRWDLPYTNTKVKEERLDIHGKSSFFVYYVNTQKLNSDTQNNTNVLSEEDLKISYTSIPGITGYDYNVANIAELDNSQLINYTGNNVGAINMVKDVNVSFNWVGDIPYTKISGRHLEGPYATGKWYKYKMAYNLEEPAENSFSYSILDSEGKDPSYYVDADNALTGNVLYIPMRLKNMVYGLQSLDGFFNNYGNSKYDTRDQLKAVMTSFFSSLNPQSQDAVSSVDKYVGKIIYNAADGKVYTVDKSTSDYQLGGNLNKNYYTAFVNTIKNISFPYYFIKEGNSTINYGADDIKGYGNFISYTANQSVIRYTLRELGVATKFNFNFKANVRKLPRSAVRCVNIVSDDTQNGISDSDIAQALMMAQTNAINAAGDTGRILDVQFLPFSLATKTSEDFKINDAGIKAMFLDTDDFEFTRDLEDLPETSMNKECDTIKIVSPSRASQYLFRPYNNGGIMEFKTKITLRPYNSIIYVRPSTKGLLIYDYDDKDCLVISEDFSLTNVTSEWANYVYNNRNYNDVFERQIQGREFERAWERRVEDAQKKSDEWTSRNISAQKASVYTGNLPIISSVAGAIGTAFQDQTYLQMAQIDRQYNEALYQEGIQISRDLFNLQLENIQSQPLVPSKITTLDAKLLPGVYLEYYSTNPTELQAIKDFYRFNGNRIDAYGTFNQYWGWFVRGKIIMSQFYTQPEIDELNRRLSMGIFTGVEYGNQ